MSLCGGGSGVLFRAVGGGSGCRLNALNATAAAIDHCANGGAWLQQRRQIQRDATPNSVRESFSEDSRKQSNNGSNGNKRWLNYSSSNPTQQASIRERNITVASFYNQTVIDKAAVKQSVRLTPATIMFSGSGTEDHQIMRSAKYLRKELPIRIAHRIAGFRNLPFIVGCNPTILAVHELYIRAFHILNDFPEIENNDDVEKYCHLLRVLLDDHKDVVSQLAQGFKECSKHISDEDMVRRYLDRNLTSRLGIRMLATHMLNLKDGKDGHIGIIKAQIPLREVIERWATFVANITEERYGVSPVIKISGHINARFPYIEMPLDYILPELLKNACRATVESHHGLQSSALPPVNVVIANNETDFVIKISDRGGGIPHDKMSKVMLYNFSTAEESINQAMQDDIFGGFMEEVNRSTSGPMHGYGFGLPTSRAYSEYLGGSLNIQSMQGLGTDVYLRLKHLNPKESPFRI